MNKFLNRLKRYVLSLLTVFPDEFVNALMGFNPHETISDRAALARSKGKWWGCILCKFLNVFDKGHCDRALATAETPIDKLPDTL